MPDIAETTTCPWCWEPGEVAVLRGHLLRHDDIVPERECRGSGKGLDEVAWAVAFDRMCRGILDELGFRDWRVRWSTDSASICVHGPKEIWLHDRRAESIWYYCKEAFLHEVAHIGGPEGPGVLSEAKHGPDFFRRYGGLMVRFADWPPGMEWDTDA